MDVQKVIVAAIVLYAAIYLWRYIRASLQGKRTGCGCGSESACPAKKDSPTE
ncbi:MAG: FeoB-associated Cys-rich membrane protein [Candidatus Hydrogenedentes bacterium]|nr:FeoB-associated Cys-rich membrane protein [Candidatus Hydrogenedentota bacterium]